MSKAHYEVAVVHESQVSELNTKKQFVEPKVSGPFDVLEATHFFQTLIGSTDPIP